MTKQKQLIKCLVDEMNMHRGIEKLRQQKQKVMYSHYHILDERKKATDNALIELHREQEYHMLMGVVTP